MLLPMAKGEAGTWCVLTLPQVYCRAGQGFQQGPALLPRGAPAVEEKGKELGSQQGFSASPLSSARVLLRLPLIFMLISFYYFYG